MGDFDPDAYLADSSGPAAAPEENSFDPDKYLANFNPDEYLRSDQRPAPEGPVMSGLREAAHSAIPAAAGLVGAGVGAAAGALTSPVTGPVGPFVGGVGGMVAGSMGAEYLQNKALKWAGIDDDTQRAANIEANPKSSFIGGLAPAAATMSPVKGAQVAQRVFGAGMMGGFEVGQEALNEGNVDPTKVGIAAAVGAVAPAANRLGEKLMGRGARMVPGRPNRTANPDANQAHADVDDATPETAVGDSSLAEPPPGPDGITTGNPQSAPERSDRVYPKENTAAPAEGDMLTQGHMDPATAAALDANQPATPSPAPEAAPTPEPPPQPVGPNAAKKTLGLKPRAPEPEPNLEGHDADDVWRGGDLEEPPQVDAGFPKAGEPVAVGENEATPMPQRDTPPKLDEVMNRLKGKTNPEPTEGQKEAGNYEKARERLFGHEVAYENMKGSERTGTDAEGKPWSSTLPADYGYFRKTVGADKDHVDVYNLRTGEKNFIVDQRDPDTGKFDEHKVMANAKDLDDARDTYLKAFSDEKGLARLHDITEVSPDELTQWLKGASKKKPYGAPMPKEKPQPKVVAKAIELAKLQGHDQVAAALEQSGNAFEAAKYLNAKTNKTGVSDIKTPRIRPAAPEVPGAPGITARSKADAAKKGAALERMNSALEANPPSENETPEAMRSRLEKVVADAGNSVEVYKPAMKPPAYLYVRKAQQMLARKNWKPEHIKDFKAAETLARSDNPEDHAALRGGNRIEADIARSKRSGDEAVANAEAKQNQPGVNDTEDALINAIDAKRDAEFKTMKVVSKDKTRFDVPHEEAESMVEPTPVKTKADMKELPRKTIDIGDSALAKIDTNKISAAAMRKAEAAKLAGKKSESANVPSEARKPSEGRKIDISDPARLKELIDLSNKTAKRSGLSEEEIAQSDLTRQAAIKPSDTDTVKRLFGEFASDEAGSLNLGKIKQDFKNATKLTPVKSYIARTPKASETHAEYTRGLSEELHKIAQADKSHRLDLLQKARDLPPEADRAALERIYKAREADSAKLPLPAGQASHIDALSPADRKIYDTHLKPLFDENDAFYDAIHKVDEDRLGQKVEDHISRITKGDTSEYNMLKDRDDPTGPQYNGMSVNATMAHERPFVALENAKTGQRHVIQTRDNGFTHWNKYKGTRIKDPNFKFEANQPYTVTNNKTKQSVDYIMRHATADEIAANARGRDGKGVPMKYYQNAALSAMMTHAQMGSMARHLVELARISSTPEFQELTAPVGSKKAKDNGWVKSKLPNFEGIAMDPQLRYVMDDYAKPGFDSPDMLRNLNQAVTKLLFWMPTAHIANVGAHWFVGRGFDNLNVKRGFETSMKAIKSVYNQDEYQKALRDAGAGTIYPSVLTRQFIEKIAKGIGEQFEKDPRFGPIADKLGVPLGKVKDAIYNTSSKAMWAANDMFLTQRVMELEQKGHSMSEAIKMAEKDIPNYRLPTTIIGGGAKGRLLQQIMADPSLTSFGRYHYGMWNSYANIAKDAFGPKATVGDRLDAVGKMGAAFVLATVIYPVLDKAAKLVTGNEEASENRRGPLAVPSHLMKAAQGKEDIMSAARSTLTLTPLISTVLETLFNKDFRGKPIVEPGDVRQAFQGNAEAAGHVAKQAIGHAARGLISPLNTAATAYKKKVNGEQQGIATAVRDQALDIRNPSDKAVKYERMVPIKTFRDANTRHKQGDW